MSKTRQDFATRNVIDIQTRIIKFNEIIPTLDTNTKKDIEDHLHRLHDMLWMNIETLNYDDFE